MNFTVQAREATGKGANRRLRVTGLTPGIIYGKGEPRLVQMRADLGNRFVKSLKGVTKQINLTLEEGGKETQLKAVVQDYQFSNHGDRLLHVDFREVDDTTIVKVNVPVVAVGLCPAVKFGGVLQTIRRRVPVKCMVKDLPEELHVDVSGLEFGMSVHMESLPYPEGVKPIVKGRNPTVITVAGRRRAADVADGEEGEEGTEEAAAE
ncbi:MAG: 50S ribosomal protein L25 [bacterium]|nr:50S ribosomal protein L25 [bacterium]